MSNLSVRYINQSTGASSYLWEFGDGATSPEVSPEHTYAVGGAYVVTLTATGGAGESTISKTIITVGVLNDVLMATAAGDELATLDGDLISVPAPS